MKNIMKNIIKIALLLMALYAGLVIAFESLLGYFQPANQGTLVITTTDKNGSGHDRVLSRLASGGKLYVATNHWPRAWYRRALENPDVRVTFNGQSSDFIAVPVSREEHKRVNSDKKLGPVFRILTGFPPRYFLRLEAP